jgi:hypothetical protein
MAETIDNVMRMVERELKKKPDISNQTLFEKAQKIDASIGKLTLRQFHARYPLQVKRRASASSGRGKTRRKSRGGSRRRRETAGAVNREEVRKVLLRLARDVSAAEGKAAMIDLVVGLDKYVDQVVRAVDGSRR